MDDRGSALPALAVIVFGGLIALGLAADLGRWGATWREAAFAADAGAEAGAAMIDEAAAYRGDLLLDVPAATEMAADAARSARNRAGRKFEVEATPTQVCVTVTQPFRPGLLKAVGVKKTTVKATACAQPAKG